MSRRRAGLSPSLFPFLAVLVCTLGTLILLLALVATESRDAAKREVEQEKLAAAKTTADTPAEGPAPLTADSAKQLIDQETFRAQHFVATRDKQVADMEHLRDELAHLDDHTRRLREQLKRLSDEVDRAMSSRPIVKVDQQTLVMMREEISKLETEVQQLRESATGGKPRVVLVPHKGPNGTDRRPVYVECTADGVTIWPEGTRISLRQLVGAAKATRPSANALDAALRVVRNHAVKVYGDTAPPYPLIVVRPDGIESYRFARAAMSDWDDQYGYELVPADVDLVFPVPDATLRRNLDLAVHDAVSRGGLGNPVAVGSGGQGVRGGGAAGSFDESGDYAGVPSEGGQFIPGGGEVAVSPNSSVGLGQPGQPGSALGTPGVAGASGSSPERSDSPARPLPTLSARDLDNQARSGGFRPLRDQLGGRGNAYGEATPGSQQTSFGAAPTVQTDSPSLNKLLNGDDGPVEVTTDAGSETGSGLTASKQTTAGSPSAGSTSGTTKQAAEPIGTATSDGNTASAPSRSTPMSATPPSGQASPGGDPPPVDPNVDPNEQPPATPTVNLVRREGRNWALPESMAGMNGTEVVRPISVVCHTDRYELIEQGRVTALFPFNDNGANEATLGLATAVRDRVESWGATLPGGRWQPRLDVLVAPHADRRFHELRTLMNGSGVDVIRRVK